MPTVKPAVTGQETPPAEKPATVPASGDAAVISVVNAPPVDVTPPDPEPTVTAPRAGAAIGSGSEADATADALRELLTVEAVQAGVGDLFHLLAKQRGEHWEVDAGEARRIAVPLQEELVGLADAVPFLGDAVGAVGPSRVRLLGAIAWVVGPRVLYDMRTASTRRAAMPSPAASRDTSPAPASDADGHGSDVMSKVVSLPVKGGA